MSFFSEVSLLLGMDASRLATGWHLINYNGEALYIEGFKSVAAVTAEEIILHLKKGSLKVCGEALIIHSLEPSVIVIKGKICSVTDGEK